MVQEFYTTYSDFHGISRRSLICFLSTFRKGEKFLRNKMRLLVRRNKNKISIEKVNVTTFSTLCYVKEFLNYQRHGKAISISGKTKKPKIFNCQQHTEDRREALPCALDSCFSSFAILRKTQVEVLKPVASSITQTLCPLEEALCFSLRGQNGWLLPEKMSLNSLLFCTSANSSS